MPKVVFQIEGGKPVTVDCNVGDNLLELARRANVAIDAPCSGNGSCGKCRIKLVEAELELKLANLEWMYVANLLQERFLGLPATEIEK